MRLKLAHIFKNTQAQPFCEEIDHSFFSQAQGSHELSSTAHEIPVPIARKIE